MVWFPNTPEDERNRVAAHEKDSRGPGRPQKPLEECKWKQSALAAYERKKARQIERVARAQQRIYPQNARDENGWRVPREGTESRRVYNLMKRGCSIEVIRAKCGWEADARMFGILYPDHKGSRVGIPWQQKLRAAQTSAGPMLALPPPAKLLALPPPHWYHAVPAKLAWNWPCILEVGVIQIAGYKAARHSEVLFLDKDDDCFEVERRTTYCAIHLGMALYEFGYPVTFKPGSYYVEINYNCDLEIGREEGDSDEIAYARYIHGAEDDEDDEDVPDPPVNTIEPGVIWA